MPRAPLIGSHGVFCHAVHVVCNGVTKVEHKFFSYWSKEIGKKIKIKITVLF
jgi:predicted secreted protein